MCVVILKRITGRININNLMMNISYFMSPHKIFLKYNFGDNRKCNNLSLLSMYVVRLIIDR